MKLKTGKVAFPIEFDNGEKDVIYFNPNNPDLAVRMKEFESKVNARIKELGDIKLNAEGTPADVELIDKFNHIRNIVCEEIDYAFDAEISKVVFKHCSPFAIVDGEYFILMFLEAITPEIAEHVENQRTEASKRLEKHIAKYRK
jgi:hypothetical protein